MILQLVILFIGAYLAGSINFSILLFKILKKEDPRGKFSGNPGTSNVYRLAGVFWAAVVLILDVGRAVGIAAIAIHFLHLAYVPWIGFGLILGNRYPCFHDFRGGKGVANYLGFTAYLSPISAAISALAWVIVYGIVRTTFIPSFFMILTLAVGTIIICKYNPIAVAGTAITALFIFYNHKRNIVTFMNVRGRNK